MSDDFQIFEWMTLGITDFQKDLPCTFCAPVQSLVDYNYNKCITECLHSIPTCSPDTIFSVLLDLCTEELDKKRYEKIYCLYCLGVSCLQSFVQLNWTGPQKDDTNSFEEMFQDSDAKDKVLKILGREESQIYKLAKVPHYLFVAEEIFRVFAKLNTEEAPSFVAAHWWLLRCYNIHSQVLNVHSESLFQETQALITTLSGDTLLKSTDNKSLHLQLHLELGQILLHYYQYKQASDHFDQAKAIAGIDFKFTGALGFRTRFQQKAVAQLQLVVTVAEDSSFVSSVKKVQEDSFPKDLSLNDDTLLEHVKLVNGNDIQTSEICPEHAAVILAACTSMQKASPSNKLQQEEVGAILEVLLRSKSTWCIRSEALRLRCRNEKERMRTVERSMTQLEDLVTLVSQKEVTSPGNRLDLFYSILPSTIWQIKRDLADIYMSLGAVNSALQQFEFLEMWEDAIGCLIQVDRKGAAIEMIERQLKVGETPNLWCLLGDVLQEPKHYTKAWELSKQRSSRAMRSLGGYHVSKKQFKEAVECFDKSLAVLSLQVGTWFTLGCTHLVLDNYEKAANAFRRCVSLDWDNYEAWTNLSSAYVKCNKRKEAFKALSEAIKCNFDKWQLWENYVAISTDVGHFNEAMTAYERLLNLKDKFVDIPILTVLVKAVVEDITDAKDVPASRLKPKLLKLFGHICSKTSTDPGVWRLYARLTGNGTSPDAEESARSLDFLHKSLRTSLQSQGWEKSEEKIGEIVETAKLISEACIHCKENITRQVLAALRMSVNGFSSRLKQRQKSMLDSEASEKMEGWINSVEGDVKEMEKLLTSHSAT